MSDIRYWLVVPAAGIGVRMRGEVPKQYLPLLGRTVLAAALQPFADWGQLSGTCLALRPDDAHYATIEDTLPLNCDRVAGGEQRMESVFNGLTSLRDQADDRDWVLVHDAVRPCLAQSDLQNLVNQIGGDDVGGLLAIRAGDTLKQDDGEARVKRTENRDQIWQAQTPQIFRFGIVFEAISRAASAGTDFSDESSAVEALGHRPHLVECRSNNMKITWPEDLRVAESILEWRAAT